MNGFLRASGKSWGVAISAVVCAGLFIISLLAASPQLHERLHHDADHHDHECAVTMVLDGGLHHGAPAMPPVVAPKQNGVDEPTLSAGKQLAAAFLGACIFEHAPPRV
ncbi:MAG: hypothetical protein QM796_12310 [Chthoniobacteraceae bacterium]